MVSPLADVEKRRNDKKIVPFPAFMGQGSGSQSFWQTFRFSPDRERGKGKNKTAGKG